MEKKEGINYNKIVNSKEMNAFKNKKHMNCFRVCDDRKTKLFIQIGYKK